MNFSYQEEELVELLEKTTDEELCDLVVFNDDFNTFEHVINILIKVCKHSAEQAEQCTMLIHYKGKCTVKSGEYKDLEPRCSKLLQLGLSAELV